jgi:DNA-binding transcriptional ArsR family regulator
MPVQDSMMAPQAAPVKVALAPAQNAFHSLFLLGEVEHLSGLSEWVIRVAGSFTPEERHTHALVFWGLHYAALPERDWPSFPAYLTYLAALDPVVLRDKMLMAYARFPLLEGEEKSWKVCEVPASFDMKEVLNDVDSYLRFLKARFPLHKIDEAIEAEAYTYALNPPAMQALIVSFLQKLWEEHLAEEWRRAEPMLRDAVEAFQQVDLSRMERLEAARFITGQELEAEHWQEILTDARGITFVPSAHVGPYVRKYCMGGETLWVLFGARLPEGSPVQAPDLSRTEIVVRLNALADETRLQILRLIADAGELPSQEVMNRLGLSQSATSRYLQQLSATGYLTERRCNGAKCYSLNPRRVEDTLRAIGSFLLGS